MAEENKPLDTAADAAQYETLDRHAENLKSADSRSEVIEGVPPLYMRGGLYLLGAVTFVMLLIGWFGKVHVIVPGKGLLAPEAEDVVLDAHQGGSLKTVHARPGDLMKKGQVVLTLEQPQSGVELSALQNELQIEEDRDRRNTRARSIAQRLTADPQSIVSTAASEFVDAGPVVEQIQTLRRTRQALDRAKDELRTDYVTRKKIAEAQIAINKDSITKLDEVIQITQQALKSREQDLASKRIELQQMETLIKRRAVPRSAVNQARDSVIQSEASLYAERQRIGQSELERARLEHQSNELRSELARRRSEFTSSLTQATTAYDHALVNLNGAIAQLDQEILKGRTKISELRSKTSMQRIHIGELQVRSPQDGMLTELKFTTPGQLVERGARVGTFVPSGGKLIAIVYIQNKDVAAVKAGIGVNVKVDAYPYRQYGTVPGKVLSAFPMPDRPHFKVRVALERTTIKVRGEQVALKPGLEINADLLTARKRILQLVLAKLSGED